ncbi:hypothetical protein CPB86DRAFT_623477 [Serendipita vermifera]|nr:hypothetical protein CPB86DRAFT_623477 [Serendipita vermifera]
MVGSRGCTVGGFDVPAAWWTNSPVPFPLSLDARPAPGEPGFEHARLPAASSAF